MKGDKILWAGAGLIVGTGIGFFVGYYVMGKEMAKLYDEELASMDQKIKALQDMMPEKTFEDHKDDKTLKPKEPTIHKRDFQTDYTKFSQKISDMNYGYEQKVIDEKNSEIPTDPADSIAPDDEDDDEDVELAKENEECEMYYERLKEYKDLHEDDVIILGKDRVDYKDPDFQYDDFQDLYWFVGDDTITDDDGNVVDEEELIGHELRDKKWPHRKNDVVWVRNNRLEKDFCIYRYTGTSEDFWIRGK